MIFIGIIKFYSHSAEFHAVFLHTHTHTEKYVTEKYVT